MSKNLAPIMGYIFAFIRIRMWRTISDFDILAILTFEIVNWYPVLSDG